MTIIYQQYFGNFSALNVYFIHIQFLKATLHPSSGECVIVAGCYVIQYSTSLGIRNNPYLKPNVTNN